MTPLQQTSVTHPVGPENQPNSGGAGERASAHVATQGALAGALRGFLLAIGVLLVVCPILWLSGCASGAPPADHILSNASQRQAEFHGAAATADARRVANWIAASGDNAGSAFVIVDKKMAKVYVFDAAARLRGASAALMGSAVGDDTAPGVGKLAIADVKPEQRTTPAGRFVAERGRNARGEDVVWIDYDNAVSMHRVVTQVASERRLERLASTSTQDKRISYGCINLPVAFYDEHIRPTFAAQTAVVYVLPEVKTVQQVFQNVGMTASLR